MLWRNAITEFMDQLSKYSQEILQTFMQLRPTVYIQYNVFLSQVSPLLQKTPAKIPELLVHIFNYLHNVAKICVLLVYATSIIITSKIREQVQHGMCFSYTADLDSLADILSQKQYVLMHLSKNIAAQYFITCLYQGKSKLHLKAASVFYTTRPRTASSAELYTKMLYAYGSPQEIIYYTAKARNTTLDVEESDSMAIIERTARHNLSLMHPLQAMGLSFGATNTDADPEDLQDKTVLYLSLPQATESITYHLISLLQLQKVCTASGLYTNILQAFVIIISTPVQKNTMASKLAPGMDVVFTTDIGKTFFTTNILCKNMLPGPKERVFAYIILITILYISCFIQNHNDFLRQQDSWPFYVAHNFTNKFLLQPIFSGQTRPRLQGAMEAAHVETHLTAFLQSIQPSTPQDPSVLASPKLSALFLYLKQLLSWT
uniref:PE423R n=1 Tax=African swine fever virus TaxID=10497 RepID=A0A6G7KUF0_ASF